MEADGTSNLKLNNSHDNTYNLSLKNSLIIEVVHIKKIIYIIQPEATKKKLHGRYDLSLFLLNRDKHIVLNSTIHCVVKFVN